jgi:hypothetical protein
MSKDKSSLWEQWVSQLSPEARQALEGRPADELPVERSQPPDDDEAYAYDALLNALSPEAREALEAAAHRPEPRPEEEYDGSVARYGLVECPDGDWGAMRLFKRVEGLAARVGQLEGEDVVVWAFFGLPLRLTKGPQRYLLLPNGKAIMVPMYEGGPCKIVDAGLIDVLEVQEDGYLGPPELANNKLVHNKLEEPETTHAKGGDDDDEDAEDATVD